MPDNDAPRCEAVDYRRSMRCKLPQGHEGKHIAERLDNGEITQAEFNREYQELIREYRSMAEEAAREAYEAEMQNW